MAANDDFFVSFGSNARSFSDQLKRDLKPAKDEILALQSLLTNLEQNVQKNGPMLSALQRTLTGGGKGAGTGAYGLDQIHEAVSDFRRDLGDLARELSTVVQGIKASQGQGGRVARGAGAFYDPEVKQLVKTVDVLAGKHPNAYRMGQQPADRKFTEALQTLASQRTAALAQPASVRISDLSRVNIDQGSFDRVVKAVNQVRDEIKKLRRAGVRTTGGGEGEPTPTSPRKGGPKSGGPAEAAAQESAKDLETRRQKAERRVAELEVKAQRLVAVLKNAGVAVDEGVAEMAQALDTELKAAKSELAKMERAELGITQREQKKLRRAAAKAPDLPAEEWDRRARVRERLDLALDPKGFQTIVGTGKGQLQRKDLVEMGQALTQLGFAVKTTARTTVPELTQSIVSARQEMLKQYGATVPEELRLGRKIRPDVVGQDVQDMLAALNITPADAELDRLDRERRRQAYQAGYVPKEATLRADQSLPTSKLIDQEDLPSLGFALSKEMRDAGEIFSSVTGKAGRDISEMWTSGGSAVRVPAGMVKGGEYDDRVFGFNAATEGLRQRMLGRVGNVAARDPRFNPLAIDPYDQIKGPNAKENRQVLWAARRAINELDELGRSFISLADEVDQLDGYLDRANARIERAARGAKLSDEDRQRLERDRDRVPEAEARRAELLRRMQSAEFQGMGLGAGVLETPEYRAGLMERDIYRRQEAMRLAERQERAREPYVNVQDSLGQALIGRRLAPGTRDTIIRNLPGARWDRKNSNIAFLDPESRSAAQHEELGQLNAMRRRVESVQRQLRNAETAMAAGEVPLDKKGRPLDLDKLRLRAENAATGLLGHIQSLFKRSLSIEDVLGDGGVNAEGNRQPYEFIKASNAEQERRRLDAARREYATTWAKPGKGASDQEILAQRVAAAAKTRQALTAAEAKSAAAQERVVELERKHAAKLQEKIAALDEAKRAEVAAAEADLAAARAEMQTVGGTRTSEVTGSQALRMAKEGARDPVTGAYLDPRLRDELGYDVLSYRNYKSIDQGSPERESVGYMGYGPSESAASGQRNKDRLRLAAQKEREARERLAALLGSESADLEKARAAHAELRRAEGELKAATVAEAKSLRAMEEARLRGRLGDQRPYKAGEQVGDLKAGTIGGGLRAQLRALEQLASSPEDIAKVQQKIADTEAELLRIEGLSDDDLMRELQAKAAATAERGGKKQGAPEASERAKADTAEANALRDRIKTAQDIQRQITKKRAEKDKAAKEEKAAIQAEIDELKKRPGFAQRNQIRAMRKELFALDSAAAAGGGGAAPPPPTARGAAGGDAGGDRDNDVPLLRDILTALNGIHKTLQTGVRIHGAGTAKAATTTVGPDGKPVTRQRATTYATREELAQARSGDPRQQALAAAKQQRRLERLKESDIERAHTQALLESERRLRANDAAARKTAASTAMLAHEKLQLNTAEKQLDETSRRELATLRAMNAAGAKAEDVALQQAKAVAALERSMAAQGTGANARHALGRALINDTRAQGQQPMDAAGYQTVHRSAQALFGPTLNNALRDAGEDGQNVLAQTLFGNHGFWSRVMHSTGTFIVRNFTAGFVFGLTNALQDVLYQGIITESTWIRVSDALEQTGRSAGNLRTELQGISSSYGVALNDVYMTAAGLTGVFDDVDQIAAATDVVAQLQAISMGALNAQEAMGVLASITGAFQSELEGGTDGLRQVADVLTVIQNTIGTNVETTAEGVGSLSGLAKQLKIPFQETAVYVAQIAKLTNQTGAAAGEQFGRILGAMQTGRGRAAIQEALPDSGIDTLIGAGEYGQALQVLMKNWDGLSDAEQRNLTVSLAGQRQARAFAALMANSAKTIDNVARAHNANGEAQQRADRIAATLNGRLQRLQANFQNLAQNLIRTGILNFFGVLLAAVNQVLSAVNWLFSEFNNFADSNAFTKTLKNWAMGLLGFVLTMKLATAAFHGMRASMAAMMASEGVMAAGATGFLGRRGTGVDGDNERRMGMREAMVVAGPAGKEKLTSKADDLTAKAANSESATRARLLRAEAAAARGAATAVSGVGKGLSALATAGWGANIAMLGVIATIGVLVGELQRQKKFSEDLAELNEKYDASGRKLTAQEIREQYVGPYTELTKQNRRDTAGWWGATKFAALVNPWDQITNPIDTMKRRAGNFFDPDESGFMNPLSFTAFGDMTNGDTTDAYEKWRGILSEEMRSRLEDIERATRDALNEVDDGVYGERSTPDNIGEMVSNAILEPMRTATELGILGSDKYSVRDVNKAAAGAKARLENARAEIISDPSLSDQEEAAALAELERMAIEMNDRVAAMILRARGIAEADNLSMDQIKQIDAMRPMLQQIQGTGVNINNPQFAAGLRALVSETGVRKGSPMGKVLRQLAEGNLSRVDAMRKDQKALEIEYENIEAKYLAASKGEKVLEPEQMDELEQQLIAKMSEIAAMTDQIIQAFVDESVTLAQAAAARGDYAGASAALDAGLNALAGERNRASETPEVRARRDLLESQQAQQSAEYSAQEKNTRLQVAQGRSMSSERDAELEAQITENTYNALLAAKATAQAAGRQGPPAEAIRAAKIAWINAENSLTTVAQQANIASMAAQLAGLWNGIAIAQGQEAIALQQYNDAVANAGANSVEAQNALAAYRNQQKSTLQTMDQVAQSRREAALAAIPDGRQVAIAKQGVTNARAALAAARKYGENSTEYQQALAQLYNAQQQVMSATQAVATAQNQVAIAIAEAAGNTVRAAELQLRGARIALAHARRNAGGANSAEVRQARAQVIQSQAALRDARLQDDLDTINFNLEMGRITQSAAIAALQEILRTRNLTKAQRRDLMLQIKGMKEELSGDAMWNFGDIKLPKPYLMKRYIAEEKEARRARVDQVIGQSLRASEAAAGFTGQSAGATSAYTDNRTVEININGGNLAEVRRVVSEIVGRPTRTRTAAPRRGRR